MYTKRWYFVLHAARCAIISPVFLLSLSFTICLPLFSSPPPFPNCHPCLLFSALPTWWRNHPFLFSFFWHPSTAPVYFFLSFPPFVVCLPLSVMAYQEGFYGAADLYVSMPESPPVPHLSPPPPPTFTCGLSTVNAARIKPIEAWTVRHFDSQLFHITIFHKKPIITLNATISMLEGLKKIDPTPVFVAHS